MSTAFVSAWLSSSKCLFSRVFCQRKVLFMVYCVHNIKSWQQRHTSQQNNASFRRITWVLCFRELNILHDDSAMCHHIECVCMCVSMCMCVSVLVCVCMWADERDIIDSFWVTRLTKGAHLSLKGPVVRSVPIHHLLLSLLINEAWAALITEYTMVKERSVTGNRSGWDRRDKRTPSCTPDAVLRMHGGACWRKGIGPMHLFKVLPHSRLGRLWHRSGETNSLPMSGPQSRSQLPQKTQDSVV